MAGTHYLHTLEKILEVAQTTGLYARGDMIPAAQELLEFARGRIEAGDARYRTVRDAAFEAIALMDGPRREDWDQFTSDRVIMNGDAGTAVLEELEEDEPITYLRMR